MITMMFWYGGRWAWWQAGLMRLAMTAPDVKAKALDQPPRPLRPVRGYASGKEDYLRRLRKIEGQSAACRR